ncbi:hypothetical protein HBB16_08120 [Pseudonocardia sp. MCCB 268]|nr:hypothetical protein [Pseudonocardia cytotoxica]
MSSFRRTGSPWNRSPVRRTELLSIPFVVVCLTLAIRNSAPGRPAVCS